MSTGDPAALQEVLPPAMMPWTHRIQSWLEADAERHRRSSWLLLRGLGLTYLIAFVSLSVQIHGLVGEQGILPAEPWMDAVAEQLGDAAWRRLPTLAWWIGADDVALTGMCTAGVVLSVLLIVDIAPWVALVGLWGLYLSLSSVGQIFLGYQWDGLLLEAGLLAVALAPWRVMPRWRHPEKPPWMALWLIRWLLFRLMLGSGVVKLTSGDPTWADLTAMTYHYWTQPLPNPLSWFAHHQPLWMHQCAAVAMFGVELLMPWFVFPHRHTRAIAALTFIGLMVVINITGNYGFFGVLTACLCLSLMGVSPKLTKRGEGPVEGPRHGRCRCV